METDSHSIQVVDTRPIIDSVTYEGQALQIDAARFTNCKFVKCNLHFTGNLLSLTQCHFDECTFTLVGQAANTIFFLKALSRAGGQLKNFVELVAKDVLNG